MRFIYGEHVGQEKNKNPKEGLLKYSSDKKFYR